MARPDDDLDEGDAEDELWTEAKWEQFMRRQDLKADRMRELLETLIDHPDRNQIIAREMGWDAGALGLPGSGQADEDASNTKAWEDDPDADDDAEEFDDTEYVCDSADDDEASDDLLDADDFDGNADDFDGNADDFDGNAEDNLLAQSPVTQSADELAERTVGLVERCTDTLGEDDEIDPRWTALAIGSAMAGSKHAGAVAMGFDGDAICGAIVCLRMGLAGLRKAIEAGRSLQAEGLLNHADADAVLNLHLELDRDLVNDIRSLRARVDWDPDAPKVEHLS